MAIFGLEFQKAIVIFETSTLKFVENESLTHTVDFDIGPAFSKGPRFVFSEGSGPGQGLGMLLVQMETAHRFCIMTPLTI